MKSSINEFSRTWSYGCWVLVSLLVDISYNYLSRKCERGDYRNCDIPHWSAEALVKYAAEMEKVNVWSNNIFSENIILFLHRLILFIIQATYQLIMFGINHVLINSIQLILSIKC